MTNLSRRPRPRLRRRRDFEVAVKLLRVVLAAPGRTSGRSTWLTCRVGRRKWGAIWWVPRPLRLSRRLAFLRRLVLRRVLAPLAVQLKLAHRLRLCRPGRRRACRRRSSSSDRPCRQVLRPALLRQVWVSLARCRQLLRQPLVSRRRRRGVSRGCRRWRVCLRRVRRAWPWPLVSRPLKRARRRAFWRRGRLPLPWAAAGRRSASSTTGRCRTSRY